MKGGEQLGEGTHREFGIALATPLQFRRGALLPSAALLIGAVIKVRLKASKYDFTSHIPFFSPNEECSSSGSDRQWGPGTVPDEMCSRFVAPAPSADQCAFASF